MSEEGSAGKQPPAAGERRAAPRHPSNQKVFCCPAGASLTERRQVRVRNVSRSGIAVLVDRRWEPGATLAIELPPQPGEEGPPTIIRARVVHATPQVGGCFLVGCVIDGALSDAQMQALQG